PAEPERPVWRAFDGEAALVPARVVAGTEQAAVVDRGGAAVVVVHDMVDVGDPSPTPRPTATAVIAQRDFPALGGGPHARAPMSNGSLAPLRTWRTSSPSVKW